MNRPLEIRDVENISLEATDDNSDTYLQLVAQFTCQYEADNDCIDLSSIFSVCCSVVRMSNVTHAAIMGISVTTRTASAVILQQCSHLRIQSITYSNIQQVGNDAKDSVRNEYEFGIVVYESNDIEMDSLEASNFTIGVILHNSINTSMMNLSAAHNEFVGIYLHYTIDTSMMNVSAAHNKYSGIIISYSTDTSMMNVSAAHNKYSGIIISYSTDTSMMNVSAAHNKYNGIGLHYSTDTSLMNVSAAHNEQSGIYLYYSTNTSMMNVSAAHNEAIGLYLYYSTDTCMMNVSAGNNKYGGIGLINSTDTIMMKVSAAHNKEDGMYLGYSNNTSMMNVSAANNKHGGIFLHYSIDTSMMNVSAAHNKYRGIGLNYSTDTSMMNVSAAHNEKSGILLFYSTDTSLMNVSATDNGLNGIYLYYSTNTSMMNVSAAHNEATGLYLHYSTDTSMMNVSAAHNKYSGTNIANSTDTSMMNVSAAHNEESGMYLGYSTNTSMMNVSAANNKYIGINLRYSTDTSMMNVSAANNKYSGINLMYSTDTSMINAFAAHNEQNGIYLYYSTNTNMMNVSAANNKHSGIGLNYSTDTSLMNVSAANNEQLGIYIHNSTDTSMMNVSAAQNKYEGIHLEFSTATIMMNVHVSTVHTYTYHNMFAGLYIIGCTTTHIVYHNTGNKIYLRNNTDTYILHSVLSEHSGIEMINTGNTYIINTTSFITAYNTTDIVLSETIFPNMDVPSTAGSTSEPTSLPAVITLYGSTLTITDCTFTRNDISSIKAIGSNVTISGKVLFHNNTASSGTGLIFAKNSLLITTEYSNIHFQNNHAMKYGGVFYISTEESYETSMSLQDIIQYNGAGSLITSRTECFLHVEGGNLRSHTRFTFINNTAGRGGDVLYGGLVALGYDGDWNCLLRFKNISDMSQQSGLSLISSAPSRVCLCNETGQPDCLTVADPTTHVIYPGNTITIPAVVIGEAFGTAIGSVFAQFLHTPYTTDSVDMEPRQYSMAVEHSQCSNLEYTIFSQSEECEAVLVLTHDNKEISHLMTEEDNQEISNTWEILSKEPNYKTMHLTFHDQPKLRQCHSF